MLQVSTLKWGLGCIVVVLSLLRVALMLYYHCYSLEIKALRNQMIKDRYQSYVE